LYRSIRGLLFGGNEVEAMIIKGKYGEDASRPDDSVRVRKGDWVSTGPTSTWTIRGFFNAC
jgi:hypothetical protein